MLLKTVQILYLFTNINSVLNNNYCLNILCNAHFCQVMSNTGCHVSCENNFIFNIYLLSQTNVNNIATAKNIGDIIENSSNYNIIQCLRNVIQ